MIEKKLNDSQIEKYTALITDTEDDLPFPDFVMDDGVAGEFAKIFSTHTEPPAPFYFMAFLACLGNLIADHVKFNSEISPELRLFLLILGQSADDRKSTVIHKTVSFFRDAITDFPVCFGIGSAEGLQKILFKKNRLLLCFDEFRAFTSKCKIETSVLLPCVSTLYESRHYESHTASKSVSIENASLSLLAACTTDTYESIFDDNFLAIGFPNRLFLCPGKGARKFSFPKPIPQEKIIFLKKVLAEALSHVGDGLSLDITESGRKIFQDWYILLPQSVHSKRLDGYALRLMGLLAINNSKTVIDDKIVSQAIALCDWQYKVRRRYDPIDADSKMARMEQKIRRALEASPQTRRTLARLTNAHRAGLWLFESALANLQKADEIQLEKKSGCYYLREVSSLMSSVHEDALNL